MHDNCHVCDVIVKLDQMIRCHMCNHRFCSAECAGFVPHSDEDPKDLEMFGDHWWVATSCSICRGERMNDTVAFDHLLDVFGMSRETAFSLIRGHILSNGVLRPK